MEYQDSLELVCEQCSKIFEKTDSLNRYSFCSFKCEAEFAEENSDFYAVTAKGRFPRTGRIDGELFTFPDDPAEFIKEIGRYPIDLFTFLQHPTYHGVMYPQYTVEMDNLAIMPISTFDDWLTKQIDGKTRNKARLAAKRQVEVIEVPFGDEFLTGLCQIMNETPTRQGKKFPHYGMTLERARSYAGTFPKRSIYIAAFLDRKMIGFLKLVLDKEGHYANIIAILSLISERDKSPTNALIAHAVKVCAERGISQLAYDHFSYGEKVADSLAEFKVNNGFKRVEVPRYWVPTNKRGETALKLGMQKRLRNRVPESIAAPIRKLRAKLHSPEVASRALRTELEHNPMEKTIGRWSYWLGITSVIVAIAWKGGNAFGLWRALPPTPADISYWSFYNASLMFFATSIASACRVWLKSVSKEVGVRRRPARQSADGAEPETPASIAA